MARKEGAHWRDESPGPLPSAVRHLHLYFLLLRAQARSQGAYRVSFALDALAAALITASEFAAFALVLPRFGTLSGWTLGEVALLYGLAELAFVLMDLAFGGFDAPNLGAHVRSGSFSTFLLRPAPLALQVFGSDFALRRLTRVLLAAGIVAYLFRLARLLAQGQEAKAVPRMDTWWTLPD